MTDDPKDGLTPNSPPDGGAEPQTEGQATPPEKKDDATPQPGQQVAPGKPKAPEDHPTNLGRKVKFLEESLGSVLNKLDTLVSRMETGGSSGTPAPQYTPPDPGQVPAHVRETMDYLNRQQQQEREATRKYQEGYIAAVRRGQDDVDDDTHKLVEQELLETNFRLYERHTNDPVRDAEINYNKALVKILRGSKAKPNVHGDQETAPTALSSRSSNTPPKEKLIEPDPYALKFLRALGKDPSDPKVQEVLKSALEFGREK